MSTDTATNAPAITAPQARYIRVLLEDKVVSHARATELLIALEAGTITKKAASPIIDELKKLNRKPVADLAPVVVPETPADLAPAQLELPVEVTEVEVAEVEPLAEGLYMLDGVVYRVIKAKTTGNLYANDITDSKKGVYAPGVIKQLTASHRMTAEQAVGLSEKLGKCVRCHKTLSVEASVKAGIGPVCMKKI